MINTSTLLAAYWHTSNLSPPILAYKVSRSSTLWQAPAWFVFCIALLEIMSRHLPSTCEKILLNPYTWFQRVGELSAPPSKTRLSDVAGYSEPGAKRFARRIVQYGNPQGVLEPWSWNMFMMCLKSLPEQREIIPLRPVKYNQRLEIIASKHNQTWYAYASMVGSRGRTNNVALLFIRVFNLKSVYTCAA